MIFDINHPTLKKDELGAQGVETVIMLYFCSIYSSLFLCNVK